MPSCSGWSSTTSPVQQRQMAFSIDIISNADDGLLDGGKRSSN